MKIVLLSGGKGKRLWPVSTDDMPKQFINIFDNSNSMLKRTYDSISDKITKLNIYVATSNEYKEDVQKEIPNFNNIITEPEAIGTFGAILNIAVYFNKIDSDEVISVIPIDHDVDKAFYDILFTAEEKILNESFDICLIGITPTYPSNQYGYIVNKDGIVECFKEKPKTFEAMNLISNNALWNSGIVVFRLKKILEIARKYSVFNSYKEFLKNYVLLPHSSFDNEVLEKEKNISVIKSELSWKDLGIWEELAPKISENDEFNTNIIDFENKIIKNDRVENVILVNSSNGIKLIKKRQDNIIITNWGFYETLNNFDSLSNHIEVRKLTILPSRNIDYQYQKNRAKDLYVLEGTGELIINGLEQKLKYGDNLHVDKNTKYAIMAIQMLEIVEVQYGENVMEEDDTIHLESDWSKIFKKV